MHRTLTFAASSAALFGMLSLAACSNNHGSDRDTSFGGTAGGTISPTPAPSGSMGDTTGTSGAMGTPGASGATGTSGMPPASMDSTGMKRDTMAKKRP